MKLDDIILLAKAGFSKDQIIMLSQPTQQIAQPTQQIAQPTQQIAQPTQQIAQPTQQIAQPTQQIAQPTQQIAQPFAQSNSGLSDAQFAQLLQSINSANTTIDIPPIVSVDQKLADHFTNMLVGEQPQKGDNK